MNDEARLNALLTLYQSLREEGLKSIEWRLAFFSGGFGAIVALAIGSVALKVSDLSESAPLFSFSYIIPLICIFILVNWVGEAARCQRVGYFQSIVIEPKINDLLKSSIMNWEESINSGKIRRDELFGPSMLVLIIVGLIAGASPIIGVDFIIGERDIRIHEIFKWIVAPYFAMIITGSYVAGFLNRIRHLGYPAPTSLGEYHYATRYSWKFFFWAAAALGLGSTLLILLFFLGLR